MARRLPRVTTVVLAGAILAALAYVPRADAQRLGRLIDGRTGVDLRIYRLCAPCFAASFGLGEVERGAGAEPWVVV